MRFWLVLMLLCSVALASAHPDGGIVYYGVGNTSSYANWDSLSAYPLSASSGDVHWIRAAASPVREEQIEVELHADGSLIANVLRESRFRTKTLTTSFGTIASRYRGFDVVYDRNGRAMIVYANDTDTAVYELWNGTEFIGGGSLGINDSCRGIPRWIELAASPVSDVILMSELDTTASHCAQTWNGSSWIDPHFLVDTDLLSSEGPRMDLAFASSGSAVIVFESDVLGAPRFAVWDNGWGSSSSLSQLSSHVITWFMLSPAFGDTIALTSYTKDNGTAAVGIWNGSWRSFSVIDGLLEGASRPLDLAYVLSADTLMLAYVSNTSQMRYASCAASCASWSSASLPDAEASFVQLASSSLTKSVLLGVHNGSTRALLSYTGAWDSNFTLLSLDPVLSGVEDLELVLDVFNDTLPPEVMNPLPSPGSNASLGAGVTLGVDVGDFGVIDVVRAVVTGPVNSSLVLTNTSTNHFQVTFSPGLAGVYTVQFIANDSKGNTNASVTTFFNYTYTAPFVSIIGPAGSSFSNATQITLRGNATSGNISLHGNNLSWYSDVDGFLGFGDNLSVALSTSVHEITLVAKDAFNLTANATKLIEFFPDRDRDGLADNPDTLEGDESWVDTVGIESLDIVVRNDTNISGKAYVGEYNVSFYDGASPLLIFMHNFSMAELDLSNMSLDIGSHTLVLAAPDLSVVKTVYMQDAGFTSLCLGPGPAVPASACSGPSDIDLSACLGNAYTVSGVVCEDLGSTIKISNVTTVALRGTSPASSSSGGGSSHSSGVSSSGSSGGSSSSGSSSGGPSSSGSSSSGKSVTQSVSPKAPDVVPEDPTPIISNRRNSLWWLWALFVIGVLLTIVSFMNREKPLEEARLRDSNSFFK